MGENESSKKYLRRRGEERLCKMFQKFGVMTRRLGFGRLRGGGNIVNNFTSISAAFLAVGAGLILAVK